MLNGKGPRIEKYLIKYTESYNGKSMPRERQLSMLPSLWRIVNGKDPMKADECDNNVNPVFKRRMITPAGPNQAKMGIENWWERHSMEHRAKNCCPERRCGQALTERMKTRGALPWCSFCNNERWGRS